MRDLPPIVWPKDLSRTEVEKALAAIQPKTLLSERIALHSKRFLNEPYLASSLVGSATEQEIFTCTLRGFDCVTFCETVLALSFSKAAEEFPVLLQKIRYARDEISWFERNHYMHFWIESNSAKGFVQDITPLYKAITVQRKLSILPDYPPRDANLMLLPLTEVGPIFSRPESSVQTSDIILFGSTRPNLDYFHLGFLLWEKDTLTLRHASKSASAVTQEPLVAFLDRNEVSGLTLIRPKE